jgi:hypothetical protein
VSLKHSSADIYFLILKGPHPLKSKNLGGFSILIQNNVAYSVLWGALC